MVHCQSWTREIHMRFGSHSHTLLEKWYLFSLVRCTMSPTPTGSPSSTLLGPRPKRAQLVKTRVLSVYEVWVAITLSKGIVSCPGSSLSLAFPQRYLFSFYSSLIKSIRYVYMVNSEPAGAQNSGPPWMWSIIKPQLYFRNLKFIVVAWVQHQTSTL